jgi:tRNA1Val (adenine37-N6)-methyltransferase
MKTYQPFRFKQFQIHQNKTAMKVGTDGVLLGAWADVQAAKSILDIGTGTGLIALMAAQRNELAAIDAVEIDADSYEEAKQNFEESKWSERLQIFNTTIQDFAKSQKKQYDLIISNPPYFINSTKSKYDYKNQVRHTDDLSFEDLIETVNILLDDSGKFCVILPYSEGLIFEALATEVSGQAKAKKLFCTKKVNVKGRDFKPSERLLMQFEKTEKPIDESHLIIQNSPKRHDYTVDYIELTKDFYLFV